MSFPDRSSFGSPGCGRADARVYTIGRKSCGTHPEEHQRPVVFPGPAGLLGGRL